MSDLIQARLDEARKDLLELSTRSRLLNTPVTSKRARVLRIVDELSSEIFRILVSEKKHMTFLASPVEEQGEEGEGEGEANESLPQPEDEELDEHGVAARHRDSRLQTNLDSKRLQNRLLRIYYDARTREDEQGVSTLYLALGFLKWLEAESSDKVHYAPLVLLPVVLERTSARSLFRLEFADEDVATNLSLQAKLKGDFGLDLPEISAQVEDFDPGEYFKGVEGAIAGLPRWTVEADEIVLGQFSFAKFLMYRDLDSVNWPDGKGPRDHPLVEALLSSSGFADEPVEDAVDLVERSMATLLNIENADSSQATAIERVRAGENLVIQGPPGTGKSQTIANVIGAAVADGKKILFVAEKRAALEVVKRRLNNVGLGQICLELHSRKARKKEVLSDLQRTLELGPPADTEDDNQVGLLERKREILDRYVATLHSPVAPLQMSPYQILGRLTRLRREGASTSSFRLKKAREWAPNEFERLRSLVRGISNELARSGMSLKDHLWRGVDLDPPFLPQDVDDLRPAIEGALAALNQLRSAFPEFSFSSRLRGSINALRRFLHSTRILEQAPKGVGDLDLLGSTWTGRVKELEALVESGKRHQYASRQVAEKFTNEAWKEDASGLRASLARWKGSHFRLVAPGYWQDCRSFRRLLRARNRTSLRNKIALLDHLDEAKASALAVKAGEAIGRDAFGGEWKGLESDWQRLGGVLGWVGDATSESGPLLPSLLASADSRDALEAELERLGSLTSEATSRWASLSRKLRLNPKRAFAVDGVFDVPLGPLTERIESWRSRAQSIQDWVRLRSQLEEADAAGAGPFLESLRKDEVPYRKAEEHFEAAVLAENARLVFEQQPSLERFSGMTHEEIIREFRSLDEDFIQACRLHVANCHYEGVPKGRSESGEVGIVRREINKRRRVWPIRKLVSRAGTAIQQMKPVFMMSPISVAQFLEPGRIEFDLLVIDEASQVRPVDALGAVARCRQMVVVGDKRQLPPSKFFFKDLDLAGEDEEADEDLVAAEDQESILHLAEAQAGGRYCMLRWHYRSQHDSLIAVSNKEFYDSRLFVVPSAHNGGDLGVGFTFVPDGVFDRGNSKTNRAEARAVADRIVRHARKDPGLSLGVGTFSMSQRDAVLDQLELARRSHSDIEGFFTAARPDEPFFVKNLENIQGDERDVILISVGYGRDRDGFFSMNFGPVQNEGGERRLNVLISRARRRCEVFSSIHAGDIDLRRAKSAGARVLKQYLRFAETGELELPIPLAHDFDSDFEEEVARALRARDYEVEAQVGTAGFRIDLAVRDPEDPGTFILGVECDGRTYHSARWARDRDRLRQLVLEQRGWKIHRIWSTDWFRDPEREIQRVIDAIETSRSQAPLIPSTVRIEEEKPPVRAGEARAEIPEQRSLVPYVVATGPYAMSLRNSRPDTLSRPELAQLIGFIVEKEQPIHRDEIARRVAAAWGLRRTREPVRNATNRALEFAVDHGMLHQDGDFFSLHPERWVAPRDRSEVRSSTLKKAEYISPLEVRTALRDAVRDYVGLTKDEACVQAARMLGFHRTGADLQAAISQQISTMLDEGLLKLHDRKLYTDEDSSAE